VTCLSEAYFLESKSTLPAMNAPKSPWIVLALGFLPALLMAALPARASTIWNGPTITFNHTGTNADQLTPGVAITRGGSGGLYNAVTESGAVGGISPQDTLWAVGFLTNFNKLTYTSCPLEASMRPPNKIGTNYVVHLTNEDIYLSLKLTAWGGAGGNGATTFSYVRSTPSVAVAPMVSITSPASGAVFAAPANVNILASTNGSASTVTNVQFFTNGISLGSRQTLPFSLAAGNLAAGPYALTAVATASGISTTSAVVNVSVVNPVTIFISGVNVVSNKFAFDYTASTGLIYIVQSSSNFVDWTTLATNTATASPVPFFDPSITNTATFYRVGQLPNP
jgi:hypothetical protein